jgi:hypothetical protein
MRFSCVLRCSSVIVVACWLLHGACGLLHVHVAYLRFNNHKRMHARV